MNFITAIKTCFRKYADFSGRASRSEYWYFALFIALVSTALTMINLPMLSTVFSLATLLPGLAVGWRRMHDVGKRGAWYLLLLVPIAGLIVIVWNCMNGESGDNEYGANPKGE